jgi:hypothetical protein
VVHWPFVQAVHEVAPGAEEYAPAAHGKHVDDPATGE